MKNNKGFTLTELLATVVILGLLMGIAIPAVNHYLLKSKVQSLETMGKTAAEAAHSKAVGDPNLSPGTTSYNIQDLALDGFMDKPIDPNAPTQLCSGEVKIGLNNAANASADTLDNYTYDVTINCSGGKSLHKKYDTEGNEITN